MKKNLLIAAIAITALASCSSNDFVGDESPQTSSGNVGAISFTSGTPAITRATGSQAAGLLNNNFVVFGYKTPNAGDPQKVFDNYQVNWVNNTAGTTKSNSANWEYVGYKNLPYGTRTSSNGEFNTDGVATNAGTAGIDQSIKYWDFAASSYDFFAYSLGAGSQSTWAKASAMSTNPNTYSLEGTAAQLRTCYISNKKNVEPSTNQTQVNLEFRSFLSKIELKFYETIPGYSVKSLAFYPSANGEAGTTPYLFASSNDALPTGGKYVVTFDNNGKAILSFDTEAASNTYGSNIEFSSALTGYAARDYREDVAENTYIGRASNSATSTDPISVMPNPQNTNALHLKMDFTLVSRDGSGETINMTGATAVIPAGYAMWQPNYKYTYIFKISDNTNAKTAAITGLYPITLDATVTDAIDGSQETITTVDDPSITTYAKGTMITANNEYLTGANIYIVVNDGTNITAGTNAKLYTAAIALENVQNPRPAAQGITEETVANALAHGGSVTDANGATLTVTAANGLSDISEIAANDAPNGQAITIDGVMFTPAAAGDYVFEYSVTGANYTQEEANAYNANLSGAKTAGDALSTQEAGAYNATLNGALQSGTALLGDQQGTFASTFAWSTSVPLDENSAAAYNALITYGLLDAVLITDVYSNEVYLTQEQIDAATNVVLIQNSQLTEEQAAAFNSLLEGALPVDPTTLDASQAAAYNAKLPGAKSTSDAKIAGTHYKVIKVVAPAQNPEPQNP